MADKSAPAENLPAVKVPEIKTRADAEAALEQLAKDTKELAAVTATADKAISKIREANRPTLEKLSAQMQGRHAALEAWATANPKEFEGEKRSLDLLHGTLSFRLGQRALEFLSRETPEKIIPRLKKKFKEWLRYKTTINSAQILKDTAGDEPKVDPKELSALGLKITQDERFHVELKEL